MNAFTMKPDVSAFFKKANANAKSAEATRKRVMTSAASHMQTKTADLRKSQIQLKGKA